MANRPTIYLTNAASRRPPHRGPGRVLTIMAAPRPQYGEGGEGRVTILTPTRGSFQRLKAGRLTLEEYRQEYLVRLSSYPGELEPGTLYTVAGGGTPVADGDTLICACSRAAAAQGRCHRVWAAKALAKAGWRVILDGEEVLDE